MSSLDQCLAINDVSVSISPTSGNSLGTWTFNPSSCVQVPYGARSFDINYTLPSSSPWSFVAVTVQLVSGPGIEAPSSGVSITAPFSGTRSIPGGSYQVSQVGSKGGDGSAKKITIELTNQNTQGEAFTYGLFLTARASGQSDQTSLDPQVVLEAQD